MTDAEIDKLESEVLEVTYAEQVHGYVYRPSKTSRKQWWLRGHPAANELPHFLSWDNVLAEIRMLTNLTQSWPFLTPYGGERLVVLVTFDERRYWVEISLHDDTGNANSKIKSWLSNGVFLGDAFLRSMLKAAQWFRSERDWKPK